MKKISAFVLASSLVATAASAGGPVMIAPEGEPVAVPVVAAPTSSVNAGIVVPVLLLVVLAAAYAANR